MLERAGEQHHEALDDDDHVTANLRLVEGEFVAALIEDAKQDRTDILKYLQTALDEAQTIQKAWKDAKPKPATKPVSP